MILHVLRALFVLLMAAVGWAFVQSPALPFGDYNWLVMSMCLAIGVMLICIDILAPRKKLLVFSGTFLGLLVGLASAYALSFVVHLISDQYLQYPTLQREEIVRIVNLLLGISCCYLAISFILQTKDDFRFVIPYVEFSKQTRGARPILLDTSVIIDGRIGDIADTGILESRLVVPKFVVLELQTLSDLGDKLKRARGRRGLDILTKLRGNKKIEVVIYEGSLHDEEEHKGVDQKLIALAREMNARVLTNDVNLSKVAQLQQVDIINLNDLASTLKPVVLPGEKLSVRVIRPGEEATQGVGYLDDGTMIVVEHGRQHLNEEVEVTITSVLQTSQGRMIFSRVGDVPPMQRGKQRSRADSSLPTP